MKAPRKRSLLLLVVAAVQVPTAFAFRAAILSGTNANINGASFSNARSAAPPRMSATPEEERQAVADFKMITEEEANLRKVGGVAIGVATAAAFLANGHDYAGLSTGAFAALSTYRTGTEYQ